MALFDIPTDQISASELEELVSAGVREGPNIEFKRDLIGNSDSDKKEFLADISSFANSSGGDLLFGVREEDGLAVEIIGLEGDADKDILRLGSILRMGIDPKVPGFEIRPISVSTNRYVIIVRVRRSWLLPHMVSFQGQSKFYVRGAAGKHQLDVTELRSLFRLGHEAERHVREFRITRLAEITAAETPVVMEGAHPIVLHLVPLSAFGVGSRYEFRNMQTKLELLRPMNGWGASWRHNLDGFLVYSSRTDNGASSYVQMFRNGSLEAVETGLLEPDSQGTYVPSTMFEEELLSAIPRYMKLLREIGVAPPIVAMISLLNVKGYYIATSRGGLRHTQKGTIDRRDVLAPEVLIEDVDVKPEHVVRQLVDPIWNSAGWSHSPNFTEDGVWRASLV